MKERQTLQNKVTELEGMLEVARRERLLAYEERDKLLHRLVMISLHDF